MLSHDDFPVSRSRFRRYRSRDILIVWLLLTVVIAGYVYTSVMYFDALTPRIGPMFGITVTPLSLGLFGMIAGGTALAAWSRRPWHALGAAIFVGVAALSVNFGCPAVGCEGVEQFRAFFQWTILGPSVSASTDAGRCAYICPHSVELVPLVIGYLLVGEALSSVDQ